MNKLIKKYRRWEQRDFLRWRDELSEYEQDYFLPQLESRCSALIEYFELINQYCIDHIDEKSYGAALRKIIMTPEIESMVPIDLRPPTDEVLAKKFFSEIQEMNKITFIGPLKKTKALFSEPMNLKQFGKILNEMLFICSIVLQIKEKLFFYKLSSFAAILDKATNQLVDLTPKEVTVILIPFQISIENIYSVAKSTSESITEWNKNQQEWKTGYLNVRTQRIAQRNNLLTIIVAIVLSFTFLSIADPFNKVIKENENLRLKTRLIELDEEIAKQKELILELKKAHTLNQKVFSPVSILPIPILDKIPNK